MLRVLRCQRAQVLQGQLALALLLVAVAAAVLGVLSGVASLVTRWRRSARGAVRQQLKWYLAGALAALVAHRRRPA